MRTPLLLAALAVTILAAAQPPTICDELQAGFTTTNTPNGTYFINATAGTGVQTSWSWTFGDGGTSDAMSANHIYDLPGTYQACLVVVSIYEVNGGMVTCADEFCQDVVIEGGDPCDDLTACFEVDAIDNDSFSFSNCTQPSTNIQYVWHFGDGTNGSGVSPDHSYAEPGTYEVCLLAYWNGCTDEYCTSITVQGGSDPCDGLEAGFTWTNTPNGTQFSNGTTGTGQSTTWYWVFGDGTTGNDAQPLHTYPEPGVYVACLYAISIFETAGGLLTCVDTSCADIIVQESTDPCDGLSADFWFGSNGGNPASIFYSAATGDGPHWTWSFGDGNYSDDGPQGTYTYAAPGTYTLCLTVWDWIPGTEDTCSETSCQTVVVEGGDPCDDLTACFEVDAIDNDSFSFSNCTQPSTNIQYVWHFGDGSTGSGVDPDHSYAEPGTYEVCLVAYWGNCVDEFCTTVVVEGSGDPCYGLEAGFTWTTTPNGTQFSNGTTGTGQSTTWYWVFGDGTTSNDAQPFHTYPEPGVYVTCLYAISIFETGSGPLTCVDTTCADVIIQGTDPCDDLTACFEVDAIDNDSFSFSNCTQPSTNIQYLWHFGDGSTGTGVNPDHSYAEPGTYTVCLTAYWGNCVDEYCTTVTVQGGGNICDELEVAFTSSTTPNGTQFTSTIVGAGFQTTWTWYFGDGSTGSGPQPFHTYAEPGTYNACVVVVSSYETGTGVITCTAEYCNEVVIGGNDPCDELEACFEVDAIDNNSFTFLNCTQPSTNIQYVWHFGDGTNGSGVNPDHSYAEPGTYEVCLIAYWNNCVDEFCTTITVQGGGNICDELVAGLTWSTTPNGTQFSNSTTGTGFQTSWLWYFGDGTTSDGAQPFHTYTEPGTYEVCLVVVSTYETGAGVITCTDEFCDEVTIGTGGCEPFVVEFGWSAQGPAVVFTADASTSVIGYLWFFGDGTQGDGQITTHLYEPPGPFHVCVAAWYWNTNTQDTCWAEHCEDIDPFEVGIDEPFGSAISVFPVPANDHLVLTGLRPGSELRIHAADGRLVMQERSISDRCVLDVSQLAPGAYLVEVRAGEERAMRRVIVE